MANATKTIKNVQSRAKQKQKPSLLLRMFVLFAIAMVSATAWRVLEDKYIVEQKQIRAEEKQKMQEALGWGSELRIEKKNDNIARIRFLLRDKSRQPIKGAEVSLTLSHVNDAGGVMAQSSLTLPLSMVEPGVYRGQAKLPLPGDWDASINAQIGENSYQTSERVSLP